MTVGTRTTGLPRERHGAYSESQIKAKARAHQRRFLRQLGVRASDLDAITSAKLAHWARGQAQLDLFDATGERGSRNYWTAYNGITRTLRELESRVKELGLDRTAPASAAQLAAHIAGRYGNGGSS